VNRVLGILGLSGILLLACSVAVLTAAAQEGEGTAKAPKCDGRVATIVGTPGPDELVGRNADDVIVGLGGPDKLIGRRGNDIMCGGPGDDLMAGGKGNDKLFGGAGRDGLKGGPGLDQLSGGADANKIVQ
jgi:Ca2+-binding RTX toxin-like protein